MLCAVTKFNHKLTLMCILYHTYYVMQKTASFCGTSRVLHLDPTGNAKTLYKRKLKVQISWQ